MIDDLEPHEFLLVYRPMIDDLEPHELLLVYRRRRELTQVDMAWVFGVAVSRYRRVEQGDYPPCFTPKDIDYAPTLADLCFIQRRRRGWSLAALALKSGFSVKWLHNAERNRYSATELEPLVRWWEYVLDSES
jgi:transcriptional regulator with XRE-family HTH domain